MFFFKSTIGLYIGPKAVQLAQLKSIAGKIQLSNFVHVDIFEDTQSSGPNKDELVLAALQKALKKSKIDLKNVNSILMPGMVLLRYFQMPPISAEELEEAVRFEARKYIPFPLEQAVTGFYILKEDQVNRKLGILSLVTKEELIKQHLTVLHKSKIYPIAVETASFALLRLLEYSGVIEKLKSNAVIYIYAQRMNLIILKNGVPYFVRDISLAKKEEWIDEEAAEFLMEGSINSSDSRQVTLDNMLSELRISMEYYKKELGKEEVSKIILYGELDDFDDLDIVEDVAKSIPDCHCPLAAYLQKSFDIPVNTLDPLKNITLPKSVKPLPYTFPMLAVTIGAALRNQSKSTVEIDLFSARKKTSLKTKVFIVKMLVFGSIGLVISLIAIHLIFSIFVSRSKKILESEKRKSPKFMDLSHFKDEQLNTGEKEITTVIKMIRNTIEKRNLLTKKLSALPKLIPDNAWLSSLSYEEILKVEKSLVKKETKMILTGSVYSEQKGLEIEVVNDFSEKLKGSPDIFEGFKMIKTGSINKSMFNGIQIMNFDLILSSKIDSRG